ncbi:hypothetical protein NKR23_g4078 [Pleurostoma richardsiae]|uniref:Transcription factor domain-containing protein n=1 Tax=Pleurostoma richardsiae TaxID=41990 RepID=A0AA38RKI3_9PEZI|nr:hypothetical protein NKR23_g4078 [Pleurostoma richardsiae]
MELNSTIGSDVGPTSMRNEVRAIGNADNIDVRSSFEAHESVAGNENEKGNQVSNMAPSSHQSRPSDEIPKEIAYADWDLNLLQDHFNFDPQNATSDADFLFSLPEMFPLDEDISHSIQIPLSISPIVAEEKSTLVKDAFKMATGRWTPTARNFQADEEKNLLATQGTNIATESFEKWDCLGHLVKSFLAWHIGQEDTWIHIPTFSVSHVSIELLAAIIAGGAVRSSNRAVQKFGLAIHEVLSVQLWKTSQVSSILTRDLEFLQAYALQIEIGLWSGDKRKMEMAGGSIGNLVNMLRGGGRYRRFAHASRSPLSDECGTSLEEKWRNWVEQQSFTRLVYHTHAHCAQESITGNVTFT